MQCDMGLCGTCVSRIIIKVDNTPGGINPASLYCREIKEQVYYRVLECSTYYKEDPNEILMISEEVKAVKAVKEVKEVKAVRIDQTTQGYEALIHMSAGSSRLIYSNTLEGILEDISKCQA